jgi:hypothetical protein
MVEQTRYGCSHAYPELAALRGLKLWTDSKRAVRTEKMPL